jgi:hypothetical protein
VSSAFQARRQYAKADGKKPMPTDAMAIDAELRECEIAANILVHAELGERYTIKREEDAAGNEIIRLSKAETWRGKQYFEQCTFKKSRSKSAADPLPEQPLFGNGHAVEATATQAAWHAVCRQIETLTNRLADQEDAPNLDGCRPRLFRDPADGCEVVDLVIKRFDARSNEVITLQVSLKKHRQNGYSEPFERNL